KARLASAVQIDIDLPEEEEQRPLDFAAQGEIDFKEGKYRLAVQSWRHALVDDPRNGAILLLLGQAFFALGQYDDAAGATQAALAMLPEDKWGVVVTHYKELYTNIGDYTTQIRAAEKARDEKPELPALHFLLGYHFGYLNYPKQAVRELDKVLAQFPKDKIAQKLRDEFYAKLSDEEKTAADEQAKKLADEAKAAAGANKSETAKPGDRDKSDGKDSSPSGDKSDAEKKDGDETDGDSNQEKAAASGVDI
ncbi:MAG TPA: tetratricopeptide repeat protein, partial [Pirellulales bacterium]|nr:tetratricopeptide repeat protein [Pirellulales bacterium]